MNTRIRHLKVKIKSLAAEATIIRQEERKSRGQLRSSLTEHRRGIVRSEARLSLLAYGFLRGKRYDQLERNSKPFDEKRLLAMIDKFGPVYCEGESYAEWQARIRDTKQRAEVWTKAAKQAAA